MQCIVCGEETKLVKIFDRMTVGFCLQHYEENEIPQERKVMLVESF